MEPLLKALKEIKDRQNEMERKLSNYIDGVHGTSTEGIAESQSTIVDLEIQLALLEERVEALEGGGAVEETEQEEEGVE